MAVRIINSNVATTADGDHAVDNVGNDFVLVEDGVVVSTEGLFANGVNGPGGRASIQIDGNVVSEAGNGIDVGTFDDSGTNLSKIVVSEQGSVWALTNAIDASGGDNTVTNAGVLVADGGSAVIAREGDNVVGNNGLISSVTGISAAGGGNIVDNNGEMDVRGTGLFVQDGDNSVSNAGSIAAQSIGIRATGSDNAVGNAGDIASKGDGIQLSGSSGSIVNGGTITAQGSAARGIAVIGQQNLVTNEGTVTVESSSAGTAAVDINAPADAPNELVNLGTLTAAATAVEGNLGDETVINRGTINGDVDLGGGNDTFDGAGGEVNSEVRGGAGGDTLTGGAMDDTLKGGGGDDVLIGGAGGDTLAGGAGSDTADYAGSAAGVEVRLDNGVAAGGEATNDTLSGIEDLTGSAFADLLAGDGLDNALTGGAGADDLRGYRGNDILDGEQGADAMMGGAGNDLYHVNRGGDTVIETSGGGGGTDEIFATSNVNLPANVENLDLRGSADLDGVGNGLDNVLTGNKADNGLEGGGGGDDLRGGRGNDVLDGGSGSDTMSGGAGNDVYRVDRGGDRVNEVPGDGTDGIGAKSNAVLPANVENLNLRGAADLKGGGNALANVLTGNKGDNELAGGAGADDLRGGRGDDVLTGGQDNDALSGARGDDTFVFGANFGDDTVADFTAGAGTPDVLDFSPAGVAAGGVTTTPSGSDAVVTVTSTGETVTLLSVDPANLHGDDFIFA